MRKLFLVLICSLLMTQSNHAQNRDLFEKQWKTADSLLDNNLPKSAIGVASGILKQANQKKDVPQILKAQLFLLNASESFTEDFYQKVVSDANEQIEKNSGAQKAIWQAVLANYYWKYYREHRYEILDRTTIADPISEDFTTWDAAHFYQKISGLYWASLIPAANLQAIPAVDFAPIMIEGKNTDFLKPTLYGVLANTALDFFQNQERGIVQPENQFELSDGRGFLPAKDFVKTTFGTSDSNSLSFQAIKIYQQLLNFHLINSNNPNGFIEADLRRLEFVNAHSVDPEKEEHYIHALQKLASFSPESKATAQVLFQMQQYLFESANDLQVYREETSQNFKRGNRNLPEMVKELNAIIQNYPNSEGAANARNLLNEIERQTIQVKVEKVYLPHEAIKALLEYKNATKVYFQVFRSGSYFQEDRSAEESDDTVEDLIDQKRSIMKGALILKGAEDLENHSTEFKIDSLPFGNYYVVVSLEENFKDDGNNIVAYAGFQVSNLSVASVNASGRQTENFVLNRKMGQPEPQATVHFFQYDYNKKSNDYLLNEVAKYTSDPSGKIIMDGNKLVRRYGLKAMVVKGNDTLLIDNFYNQDRYSPDNERESNHTFFFTDRSIYRPGQTIYFKGILVNHKEGTSDNEVVANQKTTITFYDANGQKITSLKETTNAFGSFSGSFKAPESGLTGQMSISNEFGSTSFSVEEYKRPKFFVAFDTLKGDFSLGQVIKLKGYAKAYAGNNIDGATVSYTVSRNARFPYYWAFYLCGQPSSPEQVIAHGSVKTNADGSFEIAFTAVPDKSIDPNSFPVFNYEINADVTDQNGETRSGSQNVRIGYRSLQIVTTVPAQGFAKDFDSVQVTTQNLNGIFTPTSLAMSVYKLQFPGKIYRSRLWSKPDEQILSEDEFRKYFPDDAYENEADYHFWKLGQLVFTKQIQTNQQGIVSIPENTWKEEGWYVVSWKGKDIQGKSIEQKAYFYVVLPQKNQMVEKPIVVVAGQNVYEPGQLAKMWLATGFKQVHLLSRSSIAGKYNKTGWLSHEVKEQDRGGIGFSWYYVYNNREYKLIQTFDVPWNNKKLTIEWGTHRDKLLPGTNETWNLTIKGDKKEKVAAELLAGMYDASLDALKPQQWNWDKLLPFSYFNDVWNGFTIGDLGRFAGLYAPESKAYVSYLLEYPKLNFGIGREEHIRTFEATPGMRVMKNANIAETAIEGAPSPLDASVKFTPPIIKFDSEVREDEKPPIQIRKNLQETAFFFPQLKTDTNGNITFSFTMPEALTQWKFRVFAHTKDWKTGYMEGTVQTQKELMVQPNLPRFLRQGDEVVLRSKVVNMSNKDLKGNATLEIFNALTNQSMDLPFRLSESSQNFILKKGSSTSVNWKIHVPESVYQPVIIRIVAQSGSFSDGEDNPLPVLSNRMLVTETLPLPVKGTGLHQFVFRNLLNSENNQNGKGLVAHNLTVEFTGNPAWYAVQALPYLMEYPYECAEQTYNRFYANALAGHIVQQSSKVEQIFKQWQSEDTTALLSNLEKNQELKTVLLNETPWVMEAKSETEQKHRIALLFENYKIATGLKKNLQQLAALQLPDGSFPWFIGMNGNRYITQYILSGLGRLQHLGVAAANEKPVKEIIENSLRYLDAAIENDYEELLKSKADLKKQQLDFTQIQYLYLRSFYLSQYPLPAKAKKAFDFYKTQGKQYWTAFNPYMKALLALSFNRLNEAKTATQIIDGLKETAVHDEALGMYWKVMSGGYFWYQAPIEAQSMLIVAFSEIDKHPQEVAEMKTWLLKQKQTSDWGTTTATADAIYALLLEGEDWLAYEPNVIIKLGSKTIDLSQEKTQAGTGYFKKSYSRTEIEPDMGNISIDLKNQEHSNGVPISWGAVYWQYFQDMDKIGTATGPLHIEKELYLEKNTTSGLQLTKITDGNTLKVGSKVKVRIIIKSDRDMNFVHLKDMRAATFEPIDVLSGYHYQGGLGYYQSTLDASTNFFFDDLPKGTYVLEYEVFVGQKGDFSNGISTIQCMYAPEFSSHSKGIRVIVD